MNFKVISRNVGKALLVNALFMLFAILVSVWNGYDEGLMPLLCSFVIVLTVGFFPLIFVRENTAIKLREGFVIIVLSWLFSFFSGMLPYVLYGGEFSVVNAWFESVSGYTTTGATILTDVESLPKSILFWRSSTHYIGGLGVVVFLLLILPDSSPFKLRLSNLEISSMSKTGYKYKAGTTVRVMLLIYAGLTLALVLSLAAAGMSWFDALNHSFSTVSTGGFSTKNTSIMYYDSLAIDLIITVFMILSSIHFGIIFSVIARRTLKPFNSSIIRYYLSIISVLVISISFVLMSEGGYDSFWRALADSSFQVSSYISTTGFGQADNASWPFLANLLLLFAAFHCGCSGSTTGGVKADRMLLAFKEIQSEFLRRLYPSSVFRPRVDGTVIKDEVISSVFLYIVVYVIILLVSFVTVLFFGVEVDVAFSGTLASVGNVGPGIGEIGTMGNYSSLPSVVKIIFSIDMFLGRVEIYPIIIVVSMLFRRRN